MSKKDDNFHCKWCGRWVKSAHGCYRSTVTIKGTRWQRVVFRAEDVKGLAASLVKHCGVCYANPDSWHHQGCTQEKCPKCSEPLVGCWCRNENDRQEDLTRTDEHP